MVIQTLKERSIWSFWNYMRMLHFSVLSTFKMTQFLIFKDFLVMRMFENIPFHHLKRCYENISFGMFFKHSKCPWMFRLCYANLRGTFHLIILKHHENVTFQCFLNISNTFFIFQEKKWLVIWTLEEYSILSFSKCYKKILLLITLFRLVLRTYK